MTHPVLAAINDALVRSQEDGRRQHLGASIIGRECDRELWYSFRWATRKLFDGRMLRLFNRGHLEEDRFLGWLRAAGIVVEPLDPATGGQWRVSAVFGHFGGSLDGIASNVPGVERFGLLSSSRILLEFKTHGEKSFNKLVVEGVAKSKPEHYVQMQTYMKLKGLRLALYMAINKNTDEIHCEFVLFDDVKAEITLERAAHIIQAEFPPRRISEDPSWYKCRICDHRGTCHLRAALEKNCRTCIFSKPIEGGQWHCKKWNAVIPLENQKTGCNEHAPISE